MELAAFSPSELTAFLSQPFNAHVVNEERWYGMSHLHDVCVKGEEIREYCNESVCFVGSKL